ncbi:MAG TPA: discoidin domain-containing protein [Candidatus Limnocylindrales bacterium]|nr:discoidin domain-containing protein [Candidatus Limnocylindrales bacterium]
MAWAVASTIAPASPAAAAMEPVVVDSGENAGAWEAIASPGARGALREEHGSLRVDFDLGHGRGHVIARRRLSLDLPADYMLVFRVRGSGAPNNLEIKLISGENVWWRRLPLYSLPAETKELRVARSRLQFAWGPAGGGTPQRLDAIELAVTAGKGGAGSLFIDDIVLEPRIDTGGVLPRPTITASSGAENVQAMLDGDAATAWRSEAPDGSPMLTLDFGQPFEQGGFILEQDERDFAAAYVVEASRDARTWETVQRLTRSDGGRDYLYTPDVYARYVRFRFTPGAAGVTIAEIRVQPFEFSSSLNAFFAGVAADAPAGHFPRYFSREQSYWTVIGVQGDAREALLNEDGALEVDAGSFTIEPFLYDGHRLHTWRDAQPAVSLADQELPIPSVERVFDDVALTVTAFAHGEAGASTAAARYRVHNRSGRDWSGKLFLAVRPFQVLPPWQSLNMVGGVTRIRTVARKSLSSVLVNEDKVVKVSPPPAAFGAAAFEQGSIIAALERGQVPPQEAVEDGFEHASAVFAYDLTLRPGESSDAWLEVPFHAAPPEVFADVWALGGADKLEQAAREWASVLRRVSIELPRKAGDLLASLRSNLAYILINRDGDAIQPGSRTYQRSWIRDGAMTSQALLELGFAEEARAFVRWFATYQGSDGYVPCCVDAGGADTVPEHDSFGQFLWAVADVYRYTGDVAFVREMWPRAAAAADCMIRLRATRMTEEYRMAMREAYFGLLPESISHEGYSARPVHSYWDDAFALRGLMDAAMMAALVGDGERAEKYAAERDSFRVTFTRSVELTMLAHKLETVPASVELGDFDPTSTAVAFTLGIEDVYPRAALERTFDKYAREIGARHSEARQGVGYTAYELRNINALLLLGRKAEALDVLTSMTRDQRPPAWNQWPEISWLEPREGNFLGDLPHTWIGSTFVHAVRTMLAHERERDRSLLVAAGIPYAWLEDGEAVAVRDLPTHYGPLTYRLRRREGGAVAVEIAAGTRIPEGGIVVAAPTCFQSGEGRCGARVVQARIQGAAGEVRHHEPRKGEFFQAEAVVRALPATVVFEYATGERPKP